MGTFLTSTVYNLTVEYVMHNSISLMYLLILPFNVFLTNKVIPVIVTNLILPLLDSVVIDSL